MFGVGGDGKKLASKVQVSRGVLECISSILEQKLEFF